VCGFATAKIAAAPDARSLTVDDLRPLAKQSICAPIALSRLATASAETATPPFGN
jgi:hypothetical protein